MNKPMEALHMRMSEELLYQLDKERAKRQETRTAVVRSLLWEALAARSITK